MTKFSTYIIMILFIFLGNPIFSSSLLKKVESGDKKSQSSSPRSSLLKRSDSGSGSANEKNNQEETPKNEIKLKKNAKYSIEETARILRSKRIAYFQLDHDDHVYKCIKISNHAVNLEGAVDAIVAYKTKFGDTIDDEEVDLIIRISKIETQFYEEVAYVAKKIGKVKTTVKEHFNILREAEKGNIKDLLVGIERARACSYNMKNDYFSEKRIELLINIGKLKDEERFFDIYSAMRRVGMDKKISYNTLEILYKIYLLKGDVAYKIKSFLQENNWQSRKQPSEREYYVIRDMMTSNETPYPTLSGSDDRKKVKKIKKKRSKRKRKKMKSSFGDPCKQIIKK